MNTQHVLGISVVSINAGEKLGKVAGLLLDQEGRRVTALAVAPGGSTGATETTWIAAADVQAIGPDALTVADAAALRASPPATETLDLESVLKRKVVTEGGTYVGQVAAVEVDDGHLAVTHVEVSPGFFKSNKLVPIDQLVSIGVDLVIVTDAVCAAEDTAAALPADPPLVVGESESHATTPGQ